MKVEQKTWRRSTGWSEPSGQLQNADLVIYFGGQGTLNSGDRYNEIKTFYPNACLIGCSTGGEVLNDEVLDDVVVVAAVSFDQTAIKTSVVSAEDPEDSYTAGVQIARDLNSPSLKYVLLLSDGTNVNGSDLVRGMYNILDNNVVVTGGLAGDSADFGTTYVGLNEIPIPHRIAAVGLYGDNVEIGYGSVGGWSPFGPERVITKSKGNILFELDGKPALELYKEYLGEEASKLPGSALLFPLNIKPSSDSKNEIVRTIVGVNEEDQSMIFAGDVPEGYISQLMHGDFNNLVNGAARAAELASSDREGSQGLAILVSCIGRKLLLGQQISDETEAVADILKRQVPTIGFYSYGEICHQQFTGECSLHNQTMTVTLLNENA